MNASSKILCGLVIIAALTSAVAQEELTAEQQAQKCAAEGGCAVFTRNEFMSFPRSQFLDGFTQGAQSCTKAI